MTEARRAASPPLARPNPEELLGKAIGARSAQDRARWARMGLASRAPLDRTIQAMLLRQLCLSHYEARRFGPALQVALQAIELDVLVDVLHQDAARAALAAGDVDAATAHLRVAARRGPASRRAFHLWTLGSTLFLAGRYAPAIVALERAVRWGTRDKALYRAHLALVRLAAGEQVENLQEALDALMDAGRAASSTRGYEQFLLGHLAYASGAWPIARQCLVAFVRRVGACRPLVALALGGELTMARATLATMSAN